MEVNFTDGSTVTGTMSLAARRRSGRDSRPKAKSTRSAEAARTSRSRGCELMSYGAQTSTGDQPESYAP